MLRMYLNILILMRIKNTKRVETVLKPKAILRISIPNFESLIKVYKKTKNIDKVMDLYL